MSYVTKFPNGIAQAIELILANQCKVIDDGRAVSFEDGVFANLADLDQRRVFALEAAKQFDRMLNDSNRGELEQSIKEIAVGKQLL